MPEDVFEVQELTLKVEGELEYIGMIGQASYPAILLSSL